jgi:hypothetical protein
VTERWIVRSDAQHASDLARLRLLAGLEVAEGDDCTWLRAPTGEEALERLLCTIAGQRFRLTEGDELVPWGKLVPSERLPELDWRAIAEWAAVTSPVAALPGIRTQRMRLSLVRCHAERAAGGLLTDWDRWFRYATEAPEVRLRPLVFAMSARDTSKPPPLVQEAGDVDRSLRERMDACAPADLHHRVFVLGTPLPPIPGQPYSIDGGIAVACGWSLSPAVGSAVIRKMLSLETGDVALFNVDGSFERIAAEHFVRASRTAVRASVQGAADV